MQFVEETRISLLRFKQVRISNKKLCQTENTKENNMEDHHHQHHHGPQMLKTMQTVRSWFGGLKEDGSLERFKELMRSELEEASHSHEKAYALLKGVADEFCAHSTLLSPIYPCCHKVQTEYLPQRSDQISLQPGETVFVVAHLQHLVYCSAGPTERAGFVPWVVLDPECHSPWNGFAALPATVGLVPRDLSLEIILKDLRRELPVGPVLFRGRNYACSFTASTICKFLVAKGLTKENAESLCFLMQQMQLIVVSAIRSSKVLLLAKEALEDIRSPEELMLLFSIARSRLPFKAGKKPYFLQDLASGKLTGHVHGEKIHNPLRFGEEWIDIRLLRSQSGASAVQHEVYLKSVERGPLPAPVCGEDNSPIIIVCFDGGGVRGFLQALVINRILDRFPDFMGRIWGFAGVSTGSISAAYMASGIDPMPLREEGRYRKLVEQVFATRRSALGRISSAFIDANGLRNMAHALFPHPFGFLEKRLLIVSTLLDDKESGNGAIPSLKHNFGPGMQDVPVGDAVIQSCSAPTYFGSYQGHADGGLVVNCPVSPAITTLCRLAGAAILSRVHILSFGTGFSPVAMQADDDLMGDEGLYQWAVRGQLGLSLLFRLGVLRDLDLASSLLGDRFHRFDWLLDLPIALDDTTPEAFERMRKIADEAEMAQTFEWIQKNVMNGI